MLDFGGSNTMTLHDINLNDSSLTAADFYFVPVYGNTVNGTSSGDSLSGTSANDRINAGGGADTISTDAGDDVIDVGDDYSSDVIVVSAGSGEDIVLNFDEWSEDIIQILKNLNGTAVDTFSDLVSGSSNNEDGFAVLDFGSGNSMMLHDVALNDLDANDFLFVDTV